MLLPCVSYALPCLPDWTWLVLRISVVIHAALLSDDSSNGNEDTALDNDDRSSLFPQGVLTTPLLAQGMPLPLQPLLTMSPIPGLIF